MHQERELHPISTIIFKEIIGKASADEKEMIHRWREEEPENELCYQQIHNRERLRVEYNQHRNMNSTSAMHHMKALIAQERRRHLRQLAAKISVAAAIIAFVYLGLAILEWDINLFGERQRLADQQILHGNVKAVLTLGTGETIVLDDAQKTIADEDAVIKKGDNGSLTYSLKTKTCKLKFNDLQVPRGGEFTLVLEDGTKVWLNSETKLRYPVSFVGDERRVFLEGEALFKVAKGSKPFIVESQGQLVKVYGTEFNISAYPSDHLIYTTLIEGHVGIQAESIGSIVDLVPGVQSMFNKNSLEINLRQVNTDEITSWRTGMIVFEYQSFEQIMQTLARWYDFEYQYAGSDVRDLQYKGKVPRYGDFNEVLDVLESCGGIKFRVKGKMVTIIGI